MAAAHAGSWPATHHAVADTVDSLGADARSLALGPSLDGLAAQPELGRVALLQVTNKQRWLLTRASHG